MPRMSDGRASSQGFSQPLTHSSEYLDKYLPRSRDTEKNKNTATRGEPIVDKSKREKRGKQNKAKGMKDKAKNRRAKGEMRLKVASEEYDINRKREDLQKELKELVHKE